MIRRWLTTIKDSKEISDRHKIVEELVNDFSQKLGEYISIVGDLED